MKNQIDEPPVDDRADTSRLINQVAAPHTFGTAPAWLDVASAWALRAMWGAVGLLVLGMVARAVWVILMLGWDLL